jgi:hypothetical protein
MRREEPRRRALLRFPTGRKKKRSEFVDLGIDRIKRRWHNKITESVTGTGGTKDPENDQVENGNR